MAAIICYQIRYKISAIFSQITTNNNIAISLQSKLYPYNPNCIKNSNIVIFSLCSPYFNVFHRG